MATGIRGWVSVGVGAYASCPTLISYRLSDYSLVDAASVLAWLALLSDGIERREGNGD